MPGDHRQRHPGQEAGDRGLGRVEVAVGVDPDHRGENHNPGLRTLLALSDYFEIDLAYFNCKTKAECERYLARIAQEQLVDEVRLRADGMSETGLAALRNIMDFVRKAEGLPPVEPPSE
jgi:hypothetical protein